MVLGYRSKEPPHHEKHKRINHRVFWCRVAHCERIRSIRRLARYSYVRRQRAGTLRTRWLVLDVKRFRRPLTWDPRVSGSNDRIKGHDSSCARSTATRINRCPVKYFLGRVRGQLQVATRGAASTRKCHMTIRCTRSRGPRGP